MRILIITGIFPPDIGGPATYVPLIADALIKRGHFLKVVTLSDRLDHDDGEYTFPVTRIPRRKFKLLRWMITITRILSFGKNADVLFVNGLAMESVLSNMILRKPMVQKVVGDPVWEKASSLGWIDENFEDFQKKRYGFKVESLKALRAWWTRRANKVIVPSRYLAQWVANWGVPEESIKVIYNAIDPLNGFVPECTKISLETPIRVVTVGRLVRWKHVDKVIEAVARLDGIGLAIIGDGPQRGYLEELAQTLGVRNRIYFTGTKDKLETIGLMKACEIFVLNSSYEGFPHVVLEAMSCGLSVIATAVGGTTELLQDGNNGKLIHPFNDDMLYETLAELVKSPAERKRLAYEAKCTVESFKCNRMVDECASVLEKFS